MSATVYPLLIAHKKLDAAAAVACGWDWPLKKEEVLSRLVALNLERAALEGMRRRLLERLHAKLKPGKTC